MEGNGLFVVAERDYEVYFEIVSPIAQSRELASLCGLGPLAFAPY